MKKLFAWASFIAIMLAACKKQSNPSEEQYFGSAKAEINGTMVTFNKVRGYPTYASEDSISITLEKREGNVLKETIELQKIFTATNAAQRIDRYDYLQMPRIVRLVSAYSTIIEGDLFCDRYDVYRADSLQNHVTVTSFNARTKEIKGTFQATYVLDPARRKCNPAAPDTIRIRNGEFYTKVF